VRNLISRENKIIKEVQNVRSCKQIVLFIWGGVFLGPVVFILNSTEEF